MTNNNPQNDTPELDEAQDPACSKAAHGFSVYDGSRGSCPSCGRPRCWSSARTRPGERCRNFPKPELATCVFHGSGTEAAKAKSAELVEQKAADGVAAGLKLSARDAEPIKDPVAALQRLAGQIEAARLALGDSLDFEALESKPVQSRTWLTLVRESRELLTAMERNGITRRALELRASDIQVFVAFLDRALAVAELDAEVRAAIARAYFDQFRVWHRERVAAELEAPGPAELEVPGVDDVQDSGADSGTMNP